MHQKNTESKREGEGGGEEKNTALRSERGHGEKGRLGQRLMESAELESDWSASRTEDGRPDLWLAPVSDMLEMGPRACLCWVSAVPHSYHGPSLRLRICS